MAEIKVIDCSEQAEQPKTNSEDDLVKFDVEFLIDNLAKLGQTSFKILESPDKENRNSPQPDFLVRDNNNNKLIAIEHARFFESQNARKNEATHVQKHGFYAGLINFPNAEELGNRLAAFFDEKMSKEQFAKFADSEKILAARNRWSGVKIERFIEAEDWFKPRRRQDCDHFYLIVNKQLLEVF